MSFKPTPLYGGAIIADLPASYGDASNLRQIPDHQEVWLDGEGYSSVVFEILEWVEKDSDEEALQHHFADLVEGTGDSTNLLEQAKTELPKVPNHPLYSLSFIQTPSPTPTPRHKQPEYVAIHLLLLRLKEKATDIMISVNIPHYAGEYEKAAEGQPTQLMKDGEIITKKIIESFSIEDWGLFQG